MDPRHLNLYNDELHFIREMGKIFAHNHPKVAEHLDPGRDNCTDPYVERLLEGFAFLTSRVQLQYEEDFPEFSQHLLDIVYPDFLSPLPSMTIVQLSPEDNLQAEGFSFPKNSRLLSPRLPKSKVQCEYRTSQEIELWPLEISDASYQLSGDLPKNIKTTIHPHTLQSTRATIKLTLSTTNSSTTLNGLTPLKSLPIYLSGAGNTTGRIYETLIKNLLQIAFVSPKTKEVSLLDVKALNPTGYGEDNALLPKSPQSFQGYRLLQEYFALPERFLFLTLENLQHILPRFNTQKVDIYFLLDHLDEKLKPILNKSNFRLFCSPAINLFEKKSDAVHLTKRPIKSKSNREVTHFLPGHPIIIDKSNPQSFEVYRITQVKGITDYRKKNPVFSPFFSLNHNTLNLEQQHFYTLKRKTEIRESSDHKYKGNDLYITLNDNSSPLPYSQDIKELSIKALCTNRGLPLLLNNSTINFTTPEQSPPVKQHNGIQNIEPFSTPKPSHLTGEHTWKLINLLSLNHLSIADENSSFKNPEKGVTQATLALKELLQLQLHTQRTGDSRQALQAKQLQIEQGIHHVESQSSVQPMMVQGRITYARGLQITVTLEEEAFEGGSAFLFGSILNHFFTRYVSINSFTQTVIKTLERGEIMRWPVKIGAQNLL